MHWDIYYLQILLTAFSCIMLAKFYINTSCTFFHSQDSKLTGFPYIPGEGEEGTSTHYVLSGTLGKWIKIKKLKRVEQPSSRWQQISIHPYVYRHWEHQLFSKRLYIFSSFSRHVIIFTLLHRLDQSWLCKVVRNQLQFTTNN